MSVQGHFQQTDGPYQLCCPSSWPRAVWNVVSIDGGISAFNYSVYNPPVQNGSGHVTFGGSTSGVTDFRGVMPVDALSCTIGVSCSADQACIVQVAGTDNSHVADCNAADTPMPNSFPDKICCHIQEKCWNGVDDNGDGFIDCADPDCNGQLNPPQVCGNATEGYGTWQNTSGCVVGYNYTTGTTIYNDSCIGTPPQNTPYYCGYGKYDDPVQEPTGVCCPVGYRPFWNADPFNPHWECKESAQCGINPISQACGFDFDLNTTSWYSSAYSGDVNNWCNTQVTDLLYPLDDVQPDYQGSTGCCLIPKFGQIDYWLDKNNVKIWG